MLAIQVNNVYKKFKMFYDKGQTFKDRILFRNRNYYEDRWVLSGVGLEINKGEVVGMIGHNGCGKSTLLKLMTKIMYPDKGTIKTNGRVSSLIELGAGFHPDMRGKENIYTNASIFGLSKKEIDQRLDEIIAFSELEAFINNPVRTYSSGMYMRLAFSVAINVDADILLIDEILAVGDANFQIKCFKKLAELKNAGTTIVMVTHDMGTVENFCTKAVWLNDGVITSYGEPTQVVADYTCFMAKKREKNSPMHLEKAHTVSALDEPSVLEAAPIVTDEQKMSINYSDNRFGLRYIEITGVEICDGDDRPSNTLQSFQPMNLHISYLRHKNLMGYVFGFSIHTPDSIMITGSNTQLDKLEIRKLKQQGRVTLRINRLPLLPGTYILQVAVVDPDGIPMDYYWEYERFEVINGDGSVGLVGFDRAWEID